MNLSATSELDINRHRFLGPVTHGTSYYSKCLLAGGLACRPKYAAITPVDVAKCNLQVNPVEYPGTLSAIQTLLKSEGARGSSKESGPRWWTTPCKGCSR
ncbi:hypothetical protein B0H19DRAFT_537985 [Mycena capillaripes]|nr:hypothetical protein B0H19DRAFT_537985 [Mycena capillaripes]